MNSDADTPDDRPGWLPFFAGVAAFACACAVFWSFDSPWTLRGENASVFYPMNLAAFRAWSAGRVPEWSEQFWGGLPLLADPVALGLYWPNFLFFLATPEPHLRAYDLATAFHSGVLVSGVVYLLRLLGVRPSAALLGGLLIFIAPTYVWMAASIFTLYAPTAWWPWMLVAAELLSRHGLSARALAIGWISLASCAVVFPEFALYGGLLCALWLLTGGRRPLGHRLLSLVVLGLGGLALAAPQLWTTALFLGEAARGADLGVVRTSDIAQVLFSVDTVLYPGNEWIPAFLGIATLVLVAAGMSSRAPRTVLLAAVAVVSFLLSLGDQTPLYAGFRSLPVLDLFRSPMKLKQIAELSASLLAAIGLAHMLERRGGRTLVYLLAGMAVAEHVTYLAMRVPTGDNLPGDFGVAFSEVQAITGDLPKFIRNPSEPPGPRVSDRSGLRSLLSVEGYSVLGGAPTALLTRRHRHIRDAYELRPGPSQDEMNYFAVHYDIRPDPGPKPRDTNPCLTMASARGLLLAGRWHNTCLYLNNDRPQRFVIPDAVRRAPDLETMVDQVVRELRGGALLIATRVDETTSRHASDPWTGKNTAAQATPGWTEAEIRRLDVSLDPTIPIAAPAAEIRDRDRATGRVELIDYSPGSVRLRTTSDQPAFVLVKESYYRGWRALVDREEVPVYPAAALFFAVPIPAGEHEVRLSFRTPGLRAGTAIAVAWIGASLALALIGRAKRSIPAARPHDSEQTPPDG